MSEFKKGDKIKVKSLRHGPKEYEQVPGEIFEVQYYVKVEIDGHEHIKMLKANDLEKM